MNINSVIELEKNIGAIIDDVISNDQNHFKHPDPASELRGRVYSLIGDSFGQVSAQTQALFFRARCDLMDSESLQCDILTLSERVSKNHGPANCIKLLRALSKMQIPPDEFPLPFENDLKSIVERVHAYNSLILLKKSSRELTEDSIVWQKMHESQVWIQEIFSYCIEGITLISEKKVPEHKLSSEKYASSMWKAVHKHTEMSIGVQMEDFLASMIKDLGQIDPQEVVIRAKNTEWYKNLKATIERTQEHAGYARYDSNHSLTVDKLIEAVDLYLLFQVHMQQSIYMEKNIVQIFQKAVGSLGIMGTIDLMASVDQGPAEIENMLKSYQGISADLKNELLFLANLFFFASVKKEGCFFDADDSSGKRVEWSLMWLDLVREHMIKALYTISEGNYFKRLESLPPLPSAPAPSQAPFLIPSIQPSAPLESPRQDDMQIDFAVALWYRYIPGQEGREQDLIEKIWKNASFMKMTEDMVQFFEAVPLTRDMSSDTLALVKDFFVNPELNRLELKFINDPYVYCFKKDGKLQAVSIASLVVDGLVTSEEIKLKDHQESIQLVNSTTYDDLVIDKSEFPVTRENIIAERESPVFLKLFYNARELEFAIASHQEMLLPSMKAYKNIELAVMLGQAVPHSFISTNVGCRR